MKTKLFLNAVLAIIMAIMQSQAQQSPTISSFTPTSGAIGTSVVIYGTNFNPIPTDNIVFFGATQALVYSGDTTSLTVSVPVGATFHPISVLNTNNGLTGYSNQPFNITFSCGGVIDTNSFNEKVDSATEIDPYSTAIGDIDGDGKSDVAVANVGDNTISVFRNLSTVGTISFAPKVNFLSGTNPYVVTIEDIDGDGKPDLAVANNGSNKISVLRNTSSIGTISFAPKIEYATANNLVNIAICDVDEDGRPDIAVANRGSDIISIFRNTSIVGAISFAAKVNFATGVSPECVTLGDIDGDGKSDIAVANNSSSTVSVFRNKSTVGNISFAAKVDYATGFAPRSAAIADIDGDGKPEIAVANNASSSISIFKNTSVVDTISFAPKVDFSTSNYPYVVATDDLDGDGNPDLATANNGSNVVSVFKNTSSLGNISFATKVDYTVGSSLFNIVIGDLDGDGKPDLTATNYGSDNISILKNTINGELIHFSNTICNDDSILLQGNYQTSAGIYYDSLSSVNGCDSIIVTTLIVNPTYTISSSVTICSGDSIFLEGDNQTTSGIYYDTLITINGCDSIIITTLTIGSVYSEEDSIMICGNDSMYLQGDYQKISGTYYDTMQSIIGCDSIIITTLFVNSISIYDTNFITIIDTISIYDTNFVTVTDTNFFTINDTVPINDTTFIIVTDTTFITVNDTNFIIINDTLLVFDTTFVTVTDTTFITVNDTNYVTIYDSIAVTDTLIIDVITGLNPPDNFNIIKIYPNPAMTHITIDNGNYSLLSDYSIKITNTLSQIVFQSLINQQQFYIDITTWTGNGTYFVSIYDPLNNLIDVRKIILQ